MNLLLFGALSHLMPASVSQVDQALPVQTVCIDCRAILNCQWNGFEAKIIDWYKQSDHGHMQFIYTTGGFYLPVGRFSGVKENNTKSYSLVIENVWLNDSGIYFCSLQFPRKFGTGTKLVVTADLPTIFLLTPPLEEVARMEMVPLVCLVRGAPSSSLPITWYISGTVSKGQIDSDSFDLDGSYSVRSLFWISAQTWRNGIVCTCGTEGLISDSVSAQKESDGVLTSVCHFLLFAGLLPTLLFLVLGMTILAIRKKHKQDNSESGNQRIKARRKSTENEIYAQLAINTL
ncbi:M1-specific T cell receptor beta chain-like [Narcine bancroftii]|uniref:M1-specific T cell receptor beta chain-like n=1 Tax=Narcine bancroftii TaxID=1343680 RepID=UPI003831928B